MADTKNSLPEGTNSVIDGGGTGAGTGGLARSGTLSTTGGTSSSSGSTGARTGSTGSGSPPSSLVSATGGDMAGIGVSGRGTSDDKDATAAGSSAKDSDSSAKDSESGSGGIRGIVGNVSTKAKGEAANRARELVGDGLKSGSATLGNISTLIGDTVEQIEEKLGPQYAGYARTASDAIQRYASTLENKNPDELVDDARDLVRKSPGVALAGAAILGFAAVRLLKAGMDGATGTTSTTTRDGDTRRSRKDS